MSELTLAQINAEIESLQKMAIAIRSKEVAGVIEKMKEAIKHYELKPQDLFGDSVVLASSGKPKGGAKKGASPAKYADSNGNTWTGHGKRPQWFKQAIENGATPESLLVKA